MSNPYSQGVRKHNVHLAWQDRTKQAYLQRDAGAGRAQCLVCPRACVVEENKVGWCKVKKNLGGTLYAQSYGKATHVTIERIETEALFHFRPGDKILSLGNVGCNLDCDYCQNWMYSQVQYTAPEHVHGYTTQQIIDTALANDVKVLSWTYNDPAVWFEFVVDTAREARKHGLLNLFKSAFFLSTEAVRRLCEVIDVFAISIKAMDEAYYRRFTKGWLEPVLENTRIVHRSGIHYEISNLVVTGLTNNVDAYDRMIDFVLRDLSPETPLHFTRFHPDYKYMQYEKTPVDDVMAARQRALDRGLQYVYIGNSFAGEGLNTYCPRCRTLLIERFGLHTYVKPELQGDRCGACGHVIPIELGAGAAEAPGSAATASSALEEAAG